MSSNDAASLEDSQETFPANPISTDAVRSLYEVHAKELLAFLIGVLRNVDDATEVLQTIFRRLLEFNDHGRVETQKGWLFKLALREALVLKRKKVTQNKHLTSYSLSRELLTHPEASDLNLISTEEVARLKHLMTQLPLEQQHVVYQRIYEEKSFATIAAELKVPIATVLTRMRLATDKLRKWLEND